MNKNIYNEVELISYFNKALTVTDETRVDFKKINKFAAKKGYIVHPDCCTKSVLAFLNNIPDNYNSTFYKTWSDVTSKSRFELFIDQICHYMTTYGTDFSLGNGYVPNTNPEDPKITEYKIIEPISNKDLFDKCLSVVQSGIALKQKTMQTLCDYMLWYDPLWCDNSPFSVDSIKNREAQAYFCCECGVLPSDEFGILRCLVYNFTGKTSVIQDRYTIQTISSVVEIEKNKISILKKLTKDQMVALSKIFLRYKNIFLAMKTKETTTVINKIRKLAKKNHKPLVQSMWNDIISNERDLNLIRSKVDEISNFQKVKLIHSINNEYLDKNNKVYIIRNGKMFVKESKNRKLNYDYLYSLKKIIYDSLIKSLSKKACKIKLPENYNITLPSSEKSFVGNFPFGTNFKMSKNNVIGIYWRNVWGCRDLDLSMTNYAGSIISWRGSYYDKKQDVVYSGDMTNADPEASELMYMKKDCPDSVLRVNEYSGGPNCKFRMFFANESIDLDKRLNYMVDPNNIKFETMLEFDNEYEKTLGLVHNNHFYLMELVTGKCRFSRANQYSTDYINTMANRTSGFLSLEKVLKDAGFIIDSENPDIDFTNLDKSTIIDLMR